MEWIKKVFGANWKTNLASFVSFLATVPALVTAGQQWVNHQPVDYRGAVFGLVVAIGFAVSKDGSNHSTAEQVQKATDKATDGK